MITRLADKGHGFQSFHQLRCPLIVVPENAVFEFNCWKERLQETYPEVHFVNMQKVEDGIREFLADHPTDLLMIFPKKHGFFEFHTSDSKKIALHSNIPVMSIHG